MKHMKWFVPVVLLMALVITSCAPVPAGDTAADADGTGDSDKAVVTIWYSPPGGGEAANCVVENIVKPFNEQSETVFVDAVARPADWNTVRPAVAAGGGPDIVGTPGPSFVFELAQSGQLIPLDEFSDQFGWDELFVPWALSLGNVEGQLYSLSDELETLVLYYNKTLFETNGWEAPNTMDEMYALAEEINAAGIIPFSHANADWRPSNEWFVGEYMTQVAGPDKVYQALTGQIEWTDPDIVDAVELLNQAQQNGWFMGGLDLYYTTSGDDRRTALATGEAAMNIEGTWAANALNTTFFTDENGGNEWDWVPVPSVSGESIFTVGMGNTWSINSNAENPQAAAEYLTYFYSPEVQARRLRDCGTAPGPVRLESDAMEGVDERIAGMFTTFAEANAAGNYGYTTWTFWPPKSDVYIYEEVEKVWSGDITSTEYLQGLQEVFTEEFNEGAIPPIPDR
ncbi:MAG: extracellular solute-binding protein [Chloroflexota bacterium]